jgi:putative SOS response-associated peptidase YedK
MCGRYVIRTLFEVHEFMSPLMPAQGELDFESRYNVAPTQDVPILRISPANELHLEMVRWGLIPSWASDPSIGNRMINARAETIQEKPAFRTAFRKRRCIIPADGFYEWKVVEKGKQPYFIHLKDDHTFYFAGLWERWERPEQSIDSCAILTTSPNELMHTLHDRMPVILDHATAKRWLDPNASENDLQQLLKPYDASRMDAYPVSKMVNRPQNESKDCIAPLVEE